MMRRILLAVDDSPAALAAARLTVQLAAGWGATVRAVTVVADRIVTDQLRASLGQTGLAERRNHTAGAVLRYVSQLAGTQAVECQTIQLDGDVAREVLEQPGPGAPT